MIYIIWSLLIIILVMSYFLYKMSKTISKLNSIFIEKEKQPTILWKVEFLNKEELFMIRSDVNILDKIIKLYEYKVAKFNDILRKSNKEDLERNIWWLNCLYEQHLWFYKMREETLRDIKKTNK